MKAVERIKTHKERHDLRLAAACMEKNGAVAAEVLADECATDAHQHQAKRLVEVTELNLMAAVQAYLRVL